MTNHLLFVNKTFTVKVKLIFLEIWYQWLKKLLWSGSFVVTSLNLICNILENQQSVQTSFYDYEEIKAQQSNEGNYENASGKYANDPDRDNNPYLIPDVNPYVEPDVLPQ